MYCSNTKYITFDIYVDILFKIKTVTEGVPHSKQSTIITYMLHYTELI